MRIDLLGRLVVEVDGVEADVARLGDLGRVALAFLVLSRGRPVPRDELADVLWGEDLPATWTSALRGVVSRVRGTLAGVGLAGDEVVFSELGCYRFQSPGELVVDVEEVARVVGGGPAAVPAGLDDLVSAVERAGRQFLPGAGGAWVERRQAELAALRLRGLELLAEAASASGDHGAAVAAAAEAVALAPLLESAHRALMAAHVAAGDRAAALRAYEACRMVLAEELGVGPSPATYALYVRYLADEPTEGPRTNLPEERTSFVGRDGQVDELAALAGSSRLVTLTGPGGVGKSRLALRVAAALADRFPDGVFLVELAGLGDPALVGREVLAVLGMVEARGTSAAEAVAGRAVLLVVDNCEHLVAACAAFADDVLRRPGRVRILATSREPLGVPGEAVWAVPPLAGHEAARLFVDRAGVAAPGLDVSRAGPEVARICAGLDGIPLAIELAAARARVLSPAEIADRLDDHLRLLVGGPRAAPERHRTVRAAVDWSFESLAAGEQRVFARLSVFAGGFRLDAAQAVAGEAGVDVLDVLESLVDKSLVAVDRGGARPRYRVLETLRQYGAERLGGAAGAEAVRDRHLAWALDVAEAGADADGGGQVERLAVLDEEHDNLRAALDWAARAGRVEDGLRLAVALGRFWEIRGHLGEGRARLDAFASMEGGPTGLRARALNAAAVLAQRQGDVASARAAYQEALVVQRARADRLGVATGLHGLANLAVNDGDLVTAGALFEENLAIAREAGTPAMQAASLMNLGVVAHSAFMRGLRPVAEAAADARRHYCESLAVYEELGDRYGQALALENLGTLTRLHPGDLEGSRAFHERSLAIRRQLGDRVGVADSARYIAFLAVRTGEVGTARQLHEERLAIERELGNVGHVAEALTDLGEIALVEQRLADARAALAEAQGIYEAAGDRDSLLRVLTDLGELARREGDHGRARAVLDRCRRLAAELDNRYGAAWALAQQALLARAEGDDGRALALAEEALDLAEEYQLSGVEAVVVDVAAGVAARRGDPATAVRLAAAAEALRSTQYRPMEAEPGLDRAAMVAALGPAGFGTARAEGAAMTADTRRAVLRGVAAR